jgi:hypothetical protein
MIVAYAVLYLDIIPVRTAKSYPLVLVTLSVLLKNSVLS